MYWLRTRYLLFSRDTISVFSSRIENVASDWPETANTAAGIRIWTDFRTSDFLATVKIVKGITVRKFRIPVKKIPTGTASETPATTAMRVGKA